MVSTLLTGPWKGHACDDDLRRACIADDFDDSRWLTMSVPGHWAEHQSLAGRRAVLYRTSFKLPATGQEPSSRQWLVFDGIWSSADVWLNGHYLGPTDGWFVTHEFEVTEFLGDRDEHVLVVEAMAATPNLDGPARTLAGIFDDASIVGPLTRGGIWRPVRISTTGPVRMTKQRVVCSAADHDHAKLHFRCHVMSETNRAATIITTIRPPGGGTPITVQRDHELASGATVLEWDVVVERPELWWPWELGAQPLYRIGVSVEVDGSSSDIWDRTVGMRSIRKNRWSLEVNGERLFARGVDLWPGSSLPATADPETLAGDVLRARELGLNLLRIESHVARPEVYEAADRLGMLLWQDLPMRGEVKRTIQSSAIDAAHRLVDQLGGHPSVALWCAHYDSTGTATGPRPHQVLPSRSRLFGVARQQSPTFTKSVLDRLVGRAFRRADPNRPVIDSSGTWPSAPRFDGTDTHLRFGWHTGTGRDLAGFARRIPRMVRWVTSFGAQSIPVSDDVQVRNWPPDLNLLGERFGLGEAGFGAYLPPDDFEDADAWIAASQAYQATLLRRQIETLRRLKYSPTGGFTFAALADCRPAISFSIFDHQRKPKQAVGAVRAACRPVIIVADRMPPDLRCDDAVLLDVHVVSDRREPLSGVEAIATLCWPGGEHRWAWRGSVDADSVARIGSINWIVPDAVGPVTLDLELREHGVEICDNHYQASIGLT